MSAGFTFKSTYAPAPLRRYNTGDKVVVKRAFPPGHRRTPQYIRGKQGVIERICGAYPNPEELAYGFDGLPAKVLYRVRLAVHRLQPMLVNFHFDHIIRRPGITRPYMRL